MNEMDSNSHKTAITRTKLSRPMQCLVDFGLFLNVHHRWLDYGCGRGFDADTIGMDKYDKFHYPCNLIPRHYDKITCIYVLNTVSEDTQKTILREIYSYLTDQGMAYIAVRRDIPLDGTKTQRYVVLDLPVPYEVRDFCIYAASKVQLAEYLGGL